MFEALMILTLLLIACAPLLPDDEEESPPAARRDQQPAAKQTPHRIVTLGARDRLWPWAWDQAATALTMSKPRR